MKLFFFLFACSFCFISLTSCQKKTGINVPLKKGFAFLQKEQLADGSWDIEKHGAQYLKSDGVIAISALILYALSFSETSSQSQIKSIQFLKNHQKQNGQLGEHNYANGLALLALSKQSVQENNEISDLLAKHLLKKQSPVGGWDYIEGNSNRNDCSISAWVLAGLHAKYIRRNNPLINNAIHQFNQMLLKDLKGAGDRSILSKGESAYTYGENPHLSRGPIRPPGSTIQAKILFIKSLQKDKHLDAWVEKALEDQTKPTTDDTPLNLYRYFFVIMAIKNYKIKKYDSWLINLKKKIRNKQDQMGYWTAETAAEKNGGNLMSTALAIIILNH